METVLIIRAIKKERQEWMRGEDGEASLLSRRDREKGEEGQGKGTKGEEHPHTMKHTY